MKSRQRSDRGIQYNCTEERGNNGQRNILNYTKKRMKGRLHRVNDIVDDGIEKVRRRSETNTDARGKGFSKQSSAL